MLEIFFFLALRSLQSDQQMQEGTNEIIWKWTSIATLLFLKSSPQQNCLTTHIPTATSSEQKLPYKRCGWLDSVLWSWADPYLGMCEMWEETHRTNIDLGVAGRVPRQIAGEKRFNVNKVLKMRALSSTPQVAKLIGTLGKFRRPVGSFHWDKPGSCTVLTKKGRRSWLTLG